MTTNDFAFALATSALASGTAGWVLLYPPLLIVAFLLLLIAVGVLVADDRSSVGDLVATAGVIGTVGGGVMVAGYMLHANAVLYGGLVVWALALVTFAAEVYVAKVKR